MNSTGVGVETWPQNLTSPPISRSNQPQINPFTQAASQYPQPLFSDNFDPQFRSSNVSLPSFWDSNVELWFATVEHAFSANRIFDEHKRFSLVLSALDLKYIQKIQHVVRSPTTHPYQDIKLALIKACKLNENDRLDILFNRTELGDRKPSEMLSHMRQLLEAYDVKNTQTNAVPRKLFLDKLPTQARTILAVSLESDLDALALRANEVVAALCQTSTQSHTSSQQQLINEIFDQKLNKIIETLQMPAARIQRPSSQYEFKPNAYSSRPTFNRKSNYRYEQSYRPTQNYRPQQPYRPKQNYRPTYQNNYQQRNFPKKLASSASWVGGVETKLSTDPLFTIHDPVNNIIFVVDTGSAVSLLPSTFDSERYYGPQDLLAVNHTQLIVQGLKTLNVHLGFAQSYPWTFRVVNVPYGILGCDFFVLSWFSR